MTCHRFGQSADESAHSKAALGSFYATEKRFVREELLRRVKKERRQKAENYLSVVIGHLSICHFFAGLLTIRSENSTQRDRE
jgi:hypothetical protein